LDRALATIEFAMDGTILNANAKFLTLMGYGANEIRGKHHAILVDPAEARSGAYRQFWDRLRRGEIQTETFRRITKSGNTVWIEASYVPIPSAPGVPGRVIKFASDVTEKKRRDLDAQGKLDAIDRSLAVIEFAMDGTILTANDNFLAALGYTLPEVKGRKHSVFMRPEERDCAAYRQFWDALKRGEHQVADFRRVGKTGQDVWIHGSYNPVMGLDGTPCKVVKLASVITEQKLIDADYKGQIDAINRVQGVVHFDLDGTIRYANDVFLKSVGYTLDDVRGKHHRMFVLPEERDSEDYRSFWAELAKGHPNARVFRRLTRDGRTIWIQGSYNPIQDIDGGITKIVKYATDITDLISLSEQTGDRTRSVAEQTESLVYSISRINSTLTQSREVTHTITRQTEACETAASDLVETTRMMSHIVQTILDIAERINLLALNATIEAARAGDSGKGFAVVAAEVKGLARQTANATETIRGQIAQAQTVSSATASGVQQVVSGVRQITAYVDSVAGSMDDQNRVTAQIGHDSQESSEAVRALLGRLTGRAEAA
jgi:methyl-accepting chemotaxis protein